MTIMKSIYQKKEIAIKEGCICKYNEIEQLKFN